MSNLRVKSTVYPDGYVENYEGKGMPNIGLLPSNHPFVLGMARRRVENTFKPKKSLKKEAKVIIDMTSAKLRRAKG